MRRTELVRRLEAVPPFADPEARLEQVITPSEGAAELLLEAMGRGDLGGSVVDLGCGTGRLAIGAALLGAPDVTGIDASDSALAIARGAAADLTVPPSFLLGRIGEVDLPEGTVVMNPPFAAQNRGADRPFWRAAFRPGRRAVYAFASSAARTFIEARAVERHVEIEATRPVPWRFPATFAHHRRAAIDLPVDLWVLRTTEGNE